MALPAVVLLQIAALGLLAPPRSSGLTAAAQASVRPRECAAAPPRALLRWGPNVWETARHPTLARYCDLLARGFGQLPFSPDGARETADMADGVAPGYAAPSVLRGRAYASTGAWDEAAAEFERARRLDSRSMEDPLTMRDWARTLAHVERAAEALTAYRALGPRLSLLPSIEERARIFLEGGELALSLGPPGIDDAVAFLAEAQQLAVRDLEWRVVPALALALDRHGNKVEAASLLADLGRSRRKGAKLPPAGDEREDQAARALLLEGIDARQALDAWSHYLDVAGDEGPWNEHAQRRVEALRKRGGAR